MFNLLIKGLIGAVLVILIQLFSRSKNFYITALVPLFPTFSLISYYTLGTGHSTANLKKAIIFGMFAMIPYLVFLGALYLLVDRIKLGGALIVATLLWIAFATVLIIIWNKV
jgi:uncharacterized membrane protein (GlpM family)